MKKNLILRIVAVNLVVLVGLTLFWPQLMISPGRPMDAHAALADDCFACHTAFIGSQSEKCISCHEVASIGLRTTTGQPIANETKNVAFHQDLIEQDCLACHSEHKGVQAFRPIGRFSHQLLQPDAREQCAGCHAKPADSLHRKIEGQCTQCHTGEAWTPATFDHAEYFRFDRHHDSACDTCHIGGDFSTYSCYGCHEHSRSNIREEHWEEGIRDYENCVECHRSGDEDEAERIWRSQRFGAEATRWNGDRGFEYRGESEREEHEEHGWGRRGDHDD